MKVYNKDKTQILESYDLSQGHLESSYIDLPEVQEVKEEGHYETIAEYPETGGKDVKWVIDVEGVKYQPARKEEILIYIPYTEEELKKIKDEQEIAKLKQKLYNTDYIASKLAEATARYFSNGDKTELEQLTEKYSNIMAERQKWRERVDELEKSLKNLA